MQSTKGRIACITGANVGIGKDVARQLATSGHYRKIILACRNPEKAKVAQRELQTATGVAIFTTMILDVADPSSVRKALSSIEEPIDDLVMNAGGSGGKTPLALTPDGVTEIFASNLLGHAIFLEELMRTKQLSRAAVYAGSEAARGVPALGMKRPILKTGSVEEFVSLCDGSYFRGIKPNGTVAYGQVKLVAALWMASLARRNPSLKLLTMSPGNTSGTDVARDFPFPVRALMKYFLMPVVMPLFGIVQSLEEGSKRHVNALNDDALKSGRFYASKANALTGTVIDQSTIMPDLANPSYQDHAYEAVHRFIGS